MSQVPTLHFQYTLPRLPIPTLHKTCERYLQAQKPILSDEEYRMTVRYVEKFKKNEGIEFQELLKYIDSRNKNTSYISDYWAQMHLRDRVPLPFNCNPFMIFFNDIRFRYSRPHVRSTNLLISTLR